MAGIERGLSYESMQDMTIGQVVDFVIEYNNRNTEHKKPKKRKATQSEINAFFGG